MYKLSWIKEDLECGWFLEMLESANRIKAFKSAIKEVKRGYEEYRGNKKYKNKMF